MSIVKHIPNTITLLNLLSGVAGVIVTLSGNPAAGFICMLAAAVFDFCDGLAARLLGAHSPIGKELDSLSDVVSFGVLPAVMLWVVMPKGAPLYVHVIPLLLAAFSALRLAKFNLDTRQESDFIGLPTPAAALLVGALSHFMEASPATSFSQFAASSFWLIPALALVLSALLISELPMFGMKIKKGHKLLDGKRIVFLGFALLAVAFTVVFSLRWSLAILLIFAFYILENVFLWLFCKKLKTK
jgi:CDP-diacylglycerol--serine O-phosphatidyltransferase